MMFLFIVQPPAMVAINTTINRRTDVLKGRMTRKYDRSGRPPMRAFGFVPVFSPAMSTSHDLLRNGPTRLRTLEPSDVEWMMRWENDPAHWNVSGTTVPYSRATLTALCNGHQDVHSAGQLRWVIEEMGKAVGAIDLYEFSAMHQRSGIGILVDAAHRGKGTAGRALDIAVRHAREVLLLKGLHAQVHADNEPSMKLFAAAGFEEVGRLKDWTRTGDGWRDAATFQLILNSDPS